MKRLRKLSAFSLLLTMWLGGIALPSGLTLAKMIGIGAIFTWTMAWFSQLAIKGGKINFVRRTWRSLAAFILIAFLSGIIAQDTVAFFNSFGKLLYMVGVAFILSQEIQSRQDWNIVWYLLVTTGMLVSAQLIQHYITGVSFYTTAEHPEFFYQGFRRAYGILGGPNFAALKIVVIVPLTWFLYLQTTRPIIKIILIAGIVLQSVAIILTFSRGGVLVLSTILMLLILSSVRKRLLKSVLLVTACLSASFFIAKDFGILPIEALLTRFGLGVFSRFESAAEFPLFQNRFEIALTSLRMIADNPILGVGLGNFSKRYPEYSLGKLALTAHNGYLEVAATMGIVGLMSYLWLCWETLRNIRKASISCPSIDRGFRQFALALQYSYLAFLLGVLFLPMLFQHYYWYLVGLSCSMVRYARRGGER